MNSERNDVTRKSMCMKIINDSGICRTTMNTLKDFCF